MTDTSEWSPDPSKWPHTPPLSVYLELEKNDSSLFWRMGSGHAQNLLDEAVEKIEALEVRLGERPESSV